MRTDRPTQKGSQRIVIFAPHYAEYATRLANALAKHGAVLLFLERANRIDECGDRILTEDQSRLTIVEFNSRGRSARLFACASIMLHLLRFRPTIVNIQEEEGRFTAIVTGLIRRVWPIVLTVHDPKPHTGADADYAAANAAHQRSIRAAASAFHVHGDYCRRALIDGVGDTRPILSTHHAVLLEPAPSERREPEPGRVLMFGRMEAYKGIEVLLDALDRLRARGLAMTLVLAGRGPEIGRLASRIAGSSNVELINTFLSVRQAIDEFQRAALVALPYLNATQSGVVAAAFGNGRPVVVSRTGGLADAVEEGRNGLLVPPGDADALAESLYRILSDRPLLARLSTGAAQSAQTDFAWSHIADAMLAFIRDHDLAARRG